MMITVDDNARWWWLFLLLINNEDFSSIIIHWLLDVNDGDNNYDVEYNDIGDDNNNGDDNYVCFNFPLLFLFRLFNW